MSNDDFIVSAHALDRFEERFPDLWTDDEEVARFIHLEVCDALDAGRASFVPPVELATTDLDRWEAGKGLTAWTPLKTRGYVLLESEEGMLVVTVLRGRSSEEARNWRYGTGRPNRRRRNGDPRDDEPQAETRMGAVSGEDET